MSDPARSYRITWDPDDQDYVCECIECPLIFCFADTAEGALKAMLELVEDQQP